MGDHGTLDFKTPEPDSEDGGEQNMPQRHRCDACRIVGIKITEAFDNKVSLYPSIRDGKKELSESQIDEVLENVCDNLKTWDAVGIKVKPPKIKLYSYFKLRLSMECSVCQHQDLKRKKFPV